MPKQIVHISFRGDEETLEQIRNDFDSLPNDDRGFQFRHGTAEYEDTAGNIHPMLVMEPVNDLTDEIAYEVIDEFINPNQYDYVEVVFFCEGEASGDVKIFN